MKLYHFAGSWQLPGQQTKGASRVDLPNSPAEMVAWLNERRVRIAMPLHEPPQAPAPVNMATVAAAVSADTRRQWDGESIAEFILDRATVAQVEGIMAALGCRFGELAKAAR